MADADNQSLISIQMIELAVGELLAQTPAGTRVILFGSYARGDANAESDLDFLVVQPTLTNRRAEMVRLRSLLRPFNIPADVLVVSRPAFEAWKDWPNNVIHDAFTEGKVYGHAS